MDEGQLWQRLNRRLLAKIIAESSYEGCLQPEPLDSQRFRLMANGHCYDFVARRTVWDYLWIQPETLTRDGQRVTSAATAVLDFQRALGMDDIVLGNFLEELHNTLAGDRIQQAILGELSASDLADLPGQELESLLDGHPKALANRGRLGWGLPELNRYAPEAGQPLQLRWLAVHRDSGLQVHGTPAPAQCLDKARLANWQQQYPAPDWALLPVHPWQWDRLIAIQYAAPLARGELVDLGLAGDDYRPQQSIRTLSNADHPQYCDVKLSLTILNTSCYRGLPPAPMALAPRLSAWLADLATSDPVLSHAGMAVQRELGSVHVPQQEQQQLAGTPYRYREMLGAVWRESLPSKTADSEKAMLFAALMQTDGGGQALVAEIIRRSGLSTRNWLARLFDRVTIPLYHLLCRYGIGMVAHGQNLGLILSDWQPQRVVIKDFHGDLRAAESPLPERQGVPGDILAGLTRLPPAHLLHDLYTGHLVTTLRFISPLVEEQCGLTERAFYQLLAERMVAYQQQHPELKESFRQFDLLRPEMERVCINRVRFRIGYADDAERPLPELGQPLNNPLQPETADD
jgi:aerobactin synthase